ncbi:MAG: hypothetical protein IPH20_02170 [Bacteroidales bacterium]|nr:hypothetical protein [Bacteroidales bacterium]
MRFSLFTGGNGIIGQSGLALRNWLNSLLSIIMGDREYIPANFNFNSIPSDFAYKVWVIQYSHNLANASIVIPAGVILDFRGGKLLNVGNLVGNMTKIINKHNKDCFNTNVNFTGTWTETRATPQWFGAVCMANPNILTAQRAISSSAAIQKLFDSPFQPIFPNGYYFVTAPTIITRQVYVDFGDPIMEMIDEMGSFVYRNDHVRFYTDQNIRFWEYRKHSIFLKGGVMDVRNVVPYNSAIYYAHCDYRIQRGEASGWAIGSEEGGRVENGGGKYFHWDTAGAVVPYGYISGFIIDTRTVYINHGIVINTPASSPVEGTWANSLTINAFIDGAKQAANIADGGAGDLKIIMQTRDVLHESEKDTWGMIIQSASSLESFVWDTNSSPTDGYYRTNADHCIKTLDRSTTFSGISSLAFSGNQIKGSPGKGVYPVYPESDGIILRNTGAQSWYFSELHNTFPIIAKTGTYSIGVYDGATVNFNSETRDAAAMGLASAMANFTLLEPDSLVDFRKSGTFYHVGPGANLETDFVEVVISNSTFFQSTKMFLNLVENGSCVKKIQLVLTSDTDVTTILEVIPEGHVNYRKTWYPFDPQSGVWYKKVILRLIGHTTSAGPIYIADFANMGISATSQNYLNRFDDFQFRFKGRISQNGTNAPVVNTLLNTTGVTISTSYIGVGDYYFICDFKLHIDKTDVLDETYRLYSGPAHVGTIQVTWNNSSRFRIRSYNASGTLSNGILNNWVFTFNIGW